MQGEAEGPKWRPWAEPLCLGSFNFLLGSSGLRLGEGSHGGKAGGAGGLRNWGSSDHSGPQLPLARATTHPAILAPLSHSGSQSQPNWLCCGLRGSQWPLRCGWRETQVLGTLGSPGPQAWVVWLMLVHASCHGCWSPWPLCVVCACEDRETSVQPADPCWARSLMARCSPPLGRCHQVRVGARFLLPQPGWRRGQEEAVGL